MAVSPGGAVTCWLQRGKLTWVTALQWPGFLGPTHPFPTLSEHHLQSHTAEKPCWSGERRFQSSVEGWPGATDLDQVIPLQQPLNSNQSRILSFPLGVVAG